MQKSNLIVLTFVLCKDENVTSTVSLFRNNTLLVQENGTCNIKIEKGEHENILILEENLKYKAMKNS